MAENTLLGNASAIIANISNGSIVNNTWPTEGEIEHLLGDPDFDHAIALILGAVAVVYGRKLPQLLALVAALAFGLWTALVIHDRQMYDQPLFGTVDLPKGEWLPILGGVLAGAAAGLLCKVAWKASLVLLTAGLLVLIAMALCRLMNVSPDKVLQLAATQLSTYRVVGAVVLVVGLVLSALLVKSCHEYMITFASAFLGTLLLLSGISHFSSRVGAGTPFSLLDDLARILAEVRDGNCHLWDHDEAAPLQKCKCESNCQTEILAWIVSSVTVLIARILRKKIEAYCESRKKRATEEEKAPFNDNENPPNEDSPYINPGKGGKIVEPKQKENKDLRKKCEKIPQLEPVAGSKPPRRKEETEHGTPGGPTCEPEPEIVGAGDREDGEGL